MGFIGISEERRGTWAETIQPRLAPGETVDEVALLAAPQGLSSAEASDAANVALVGTMPGPSVPRQLAATATDRRILLCSEGFGGHLCEVVAEHLIKPLRMGRSIPGITRAGVRIDGIEYLAIPGFKKQARAFVDAVNRRARGTN